MRFLGSVLAVLTLSASALAAPLQGDVQDSRLMARDQALIAGTNIYWQYISPETLIVTIIAPVVITTRTLWDAFTDSNDGLKTIGLNLGRSVKQAAAASLTGASASALVGGAKIKALWKDTNAIQTIGAQLRITDPDVIAILGNIPTRLLNAVGGFCSDDGAAVTVSQSTNILALGANGGPVKRQDTGTGLTITQIQFCINPQDMTGVFNNNDTPMLPDSAADGCPN